jgi:hypothetical protein
MLILLFIPSRLQELSNAFAGVLSILAQQKGGILVTVVQLKRLHCNPQM